jgi:hypothetical protein
MSSPIKKPPGLGGSDFKLFVFLYLSISGDKNIHGANLFHIFSLTTCHSEPKPGMSVYTCLKLFGKGEESTPLHPRLLECGANLFHTFSLTTCHANLTEIEIKTLVANDKWFAAIWVALESETQRLIQVLVGRIKELEERYAQKLSKLEDDVDEFSKKVEGHLKQMGLVLA